MTRQVPGLLFLPLLLLFASLISCATNSADQFANEGKKKLTAKELEKGLSGRKIRFEAADIDALLHFDNDGTIEAKERSGIEDTGQWSTTADDRICITFSTWYFGDQKCYMVYHDQGDRFILFSSNGARKYRATITGMVAAKPQAEVVAPSKQQASATGGPSPAEKRRQMVSLAKNCPGCRLAGVNLAKAELIGAKLQDAKLAGANLEGANLRRANLSNTDLTGANLSQANLAGADLRGASLLGCDLSGANLTRAKINPKDLAEANTEGALLNSLQQGP